MIQRFPCLAADELWFQLGVQCSLFPLCFGVGPHPRESVSPCPFLSLVRVLSSHGLVSLQFFLSSLTAPPRSSVLKPCSTLVSVFSPHSSLLQYLSLHSPLYQCFTHPLVSVSVPLFPLLQYLPPPASLCFPPFPLTSVISRNSGDRMGVPQWCYSRRSHLGIEMILEKWIRYPDLFQ